MRVQARVIFLCEMEDGGSPPASINLVTTKKRTRERNTEKKREEEKKRKQDKEDKERTERGSQGKKKEREVREEKRRDARESELQHSSIVDLQRDQNQKTRNAANGAPATLFKVSEPHLLCLRRYRPTSFHKARG